MTVNAAPLFAVSGLNVAIGGVTVCRDLELVIHAGQCWAVLGMNGSGKTTLLHTLAGLRSAAGGEILLDGQPLTQIGRREMARRVGVLLQDLPQGFPATVIESALTGRHPHLSPWQWEGAADRELARAALAAVDLGGFERRQVGTLSGGEWRRLGLATLLVQNPALALLDEPVNHLDLHHQHRVLALLRNRAASPGHGAAMVLHDVNLARRYCDHALLLFGKGETRAGPIDEVFDARTLTRLYRHPVNALDGPHGPLYIPGDPEEI
ncbi:MAG: ABC transporter ATP-binding protein [Pseudomonadota bacterium]|nr:MAG: ABC transporter ATP-binding protein [Pseudomonadota bacterium]